ncbi:MAG: carbamoyl phosphate synthase small subunit [Oscillospiraceae bacterium]|nr:carbamoyl phosphate synthase small subunit [Oscillospiraceae bacterium]
MATRYLVLENGQVFEGEAIGAAAEGLGELVFTTGMTGYLETLTDPSYAGQIIMQTFPLIGNYGVIPEDFEGSCLARGYVVRELCAAPSNFRSEYPLDRFLTEHGVPGICGVDTRALTRLIREHGVMNALLCDEVPADLSEVRAYAVTGEVHEASCREAYTVPAEGEERFHVALMDYGAKHHIVENLAERGCRVTVLPHDTAAEDILALRPDGLMLSNGPGDPKENVFEIAQLKKLMGRLPVFGICLGHQLAALALGGETVKLKYGHRGANQPVKDLETGRCFITSQNHGYAVLSESVAGIGRLRFVNANDQSCEGMDYPDMRCFTVQFHPEASAGPHDTGFLFDRFAAMMGGEGHA